MNDFDFLAGEWTVENERLRRPLSGSGDWDMFPSRATCVRLFDGAANIDRYEFPTLNSFGLAVRLYRPSSDDWSIHWASSRDGQLQTPVIGRFEEGEGHFFGDDLYDGRSIVARYVWSDISSHSARWEQAFSTDSGNTWEANWIMNFTRLAVADLLHRTLGRPRGEQAADGSDPAAI
jgi:hypothetical protein